MPIEPRWSFTEARRGLIALGRELARRMPDEVTVDWWKEERGERIFIDYNQMARDRTIASAYSIRPTAHARVSAPRDLGGAHRRRARGLRRAHDARPLRGGRRPPRRAIAEHQPCSLEPLLELADRDDRDGTGGDLPYPPNFPKMPGEPKRVQPSKARDDT